MSLRHDLKADDGSTLVMTAFLMTALLGLMALGVDTALVLLTRYRMANAVDAAALAGVQELPDSAWNARSKAVEFGVLNDLHEDEMDVDVRVAQGEVTVSALRQVNLFFAPVLGIKQVPVSVRATARTGPVKGIAGVVPLSVKQQEFVFGEQYLLKEGSQPSGIEGAEGHRQGNFGALALGGTGANVYRHNLKYGYAGVLRVGDEVDTEPGNMAGPTAEGVAWRTERPEAAQCTFENATSACPQFVIVPIVSEFKKGGRTKATILGFAAFFLEGTTRQGGHSYVIGRFLRRTVDGEVGSGGNYGLTAYRLVE